MTATYSIRDDLQNGAAERLTRAVVRDLVRFCILLTAVQEQRALRKGKGELGTSPLEAGKLHVLAIKDDPEYESSYAVKASTWGPVTRSKCLTLHLGHQQKRTYITDHLEFFSSLLKEKDTLPYLRFDGGRFIARVGDDQIGAWCHSGFLTHEECDRLKVFGKIYASLDEGEVAALAAGRTIDSICEFMEFDLAHLWQGYHSACQRFGALADKESWSGIEDHIKQSGKFSSAARDKADTYEKTMPRVRRKLRGLLGKCETSERVYVQEIQSSINFNARDGRFLRCKYLAYLMNRATTAARNAFSLTIPNPDETSRPPDDLAVDLDEISRTYDAANIDGVATGELQGWLKDFKKRVLRITRNKDKDARPELSTLFETLGDKLRKDLVASRHG